MNRSGGGGIYGRAGERITRAPDTPGRTRDAAAARWRQWSAPARGGAAAHEKSRSRLAWGDGTTAICASKRGVG